MLVSSADLCTWRHTSQINMSARSTARWVHMSPILLNKCSQETDSDHGSGTVQWYSIVLHAPKLPGMPFNHRVLQMLWVGCWTSKTCAVYDMMIAYSPPAAQKPHGKTPAWLTARVSNCLQKWVQTSRHLCAKWVLVPILSQYQSDTDIGSIGPIPIPDAGIVLTLFTTMMLQYLLALLE